MHLSVHLALEPQAPLPPVLLGGREVEAARRKVGGRGGGIATVPFCISIDGEMKETPATGLLGPSCLLTMSVNKLVHNSNFPHLSGLNQKGAASREAATSQMPPLT